MPGMTKQTRLYSGSSGIMNRVPPELIPFDPEVGIAGLQRADNVLIGRAGQLYSRHGSRQLVSSAGCHSFFPMPDGRVLFCQEPASGGTILACGAPRIDGTLEVTNIHQFQTSGDWFSWFELGGECWFSTERKRGRVTQDLVLKDWPDSTPHMAVDTDIEYASLPYGKHTGQLGKHTLGSFKNFVFYSEPNQPSLCRTAENFMPVEGPVRMIKAAQSGVFVSDDKSIWFFEGLEPRKWQVRRVYHHPSVEYCVLPGLVPANDLGFDSSVPCVVFMTTGGPVVGFSDGGVVNLTDQQFAMPSCDFEKGSMMLVNKTNLIISIN